MPMNFFRHCAGCGETFVIRDKSENPEWDKHQKECKDLFNFREAQKFAEKQEKRLGDLALKKSRIVRRVLEGPFTLHQAEAIMDAIEAWSMGDE